MNAPTAKICLIGESLASGGAERAMALLTQFFAAKGIGVHTVIVVDEVDYDYSGELLNLGKLKNASNGPINKLGRFNVLRKYLRKHKFDYIIDFRVRISFLQEFIISRLLYDAPTVYTVHSAMTDLYFPKQKKLANLVYKSAYGVVAVSEAIATMIARDYDLRNVSVMHNPIDIASVAKAANAFVPTDGKYVLAAGRMKDNVKQFDKLINAYSRSKLPENGIKLMILGDGANLPTLKKLAMRSAFEEKIIFKGRVANPFPYMKNAEFFVLSSKREGLPTVILESFASGKPVVSFDCMTGPAEMIDHENNGLLVDDQDFEKLTQAMNRMVTDNELYLRCLAGAKSGADAFALEIIGKQWLEFLKIDVS